MSTGDYWIRFTYFECPVCGHCETIRERIYGEKPKNPQERHICASDAESYDNCMG